jgi:hypothetical protein
MMINGKKVMDDVVDALMKNKTWHLVPPQRQQCNRLQMGV